MHVEYIERFSQIFTKNVLILKSEKPGVCHYPPPKNNYLFVLHS